MFTGVLLLIECFVLKHVSADFKKIGLVMSHNIPTD
jgi:hypothetical protein